MNLHQIAGPIVAAVNPQIPVTARISVGDTVAADGTPSPEYATPGSLVASIDGTVLTVTSVGTGILMPGQLLADVTDDLLAGTTITAQLTGVPGGMGTYSVSQAQEVLSEAMTTSLVLQAQVQPITWRDLQQMEGVNLGGVKWKAYLYGEVDAVVRPEKKGGDLIIISTGRHQGVWLVTQILEQWPDWCVAAIVQQNGS